MTARARRTSVLAAGAALAVLASGFTSANAAAHRRSDPRLAKIDALLDDQARQIATQNERLGAQDKQIADQQAQLNALRAERAAPAEVAVTSPAPTGPDQPTTKLQSALAPPPTTTREAAAASELPLPKAESMPGSAAAGEGTEETIRPSLLAAIPEGMGVLTPSRRFVFEPSVEYDRFGANSIIFQGVAIIPALPTGPLDAAAVAHDVVVATGDFRYGVTDRLEVEARVPFLYRNDRLTAPATLNSSASQTTDLSGSDIGDIELVGRYQLNGSREGQPTFVANVLLKTPTGRGPYDGAFDGNGAATQLATGSGFWGVEPSLTFLLPTDPIVLFANVGYLKNFARDIDKTIGLTHVGRVDPGDSVDAAFGFGVALNPKFSFSIGYSNSYIFGASRQLETVYQQSSDLEVGALTFGWSYRLLSNLLVSTNFQFGVTPDAPDLRFTIRLPFSF